MNNEQDTNTPPPAFPGRPDTDSLPALQPRRSKKILLTVLALIVAVGVSVGVWYLLVKSEAKQSTSTTPTTTTQGGYISESQSGETKPSAIVYAQRESDTSPYELFWKPISGSGQATSALKLEQDDFPTHFQTAGRYVAVTIEGKNGPAMWLSSDSGKSYQKVWSGKTGQNDQLGDQITSILFSRDQKRLLFAALGQDGKNVVKEIDTINSQVSDAFTADAAGVFLQDYDSSRLILHYTTGCYNCDGNTGVPILRRDLLSGKQDTIVSATDTYLLALGVKSDGSELVYALGSMSDEGLGAGPPYELYTYNPVAGESTKVLEDSSAYVWDVGYSKDGTGYYVLGSKVYNLSDKKLLFDAETTIMRVGFLDKELIITESGEYPNLQIAAFDTASKKATSLLTQNSNMTFIGVVEE